MPSCDGSNCGACSARVEYVEDGEIIRKLKARIKLLEAELKKNQPLKEGDEVEIQIQTGKWVKGIFLSKDGNDLLIAVKDKRIVRSDPEDCRKIG